MLRCGAGSLIFLVLCALANQSAVANPDTLTEIHWAERVIADSVTAPFDPLWHQGEIVNRKNKSDEFLAAEAAANHATADLGAIEYPPGESATTQERMRKMVAAALDGWSLYLKSVKTAETCLANLNTARDLKTYSDRWQWFGLPDQARGSKLLADVSREVTAISHTFGTPRPELVFDNATQALIDSLKGAAEQPTSALRVALSNPAFRKGTAQRTFEWVRFDPGVVLSTAIQTIEATGDVKAPYTGEVVLTVRRARTGAYSTPQEAQIAPIASFADDTLRWGASYSNGKWTWLQRPTIGRGRALNGIGITYYAISFDELVKFDKGPEVK